MEHATKQEIDGLGGRVTSVEQKQAVFENECGHLRRDIDTNESCITRLFGEVNTLHKLTSKIFGGVAAIVFVMNLITVIAISFLVK